MTFKLLTVIMFVSYSDIPSPPGKPNVLETSDTFINICWDEPQEKGGSEINFYVVEYQEINTTE